MSNEARVSRCQEGENKQFTGEVLRVFFVNEVGEITSVVEDHVQGLASGEGSKGLLNTPSVLLLSLTLPGIDGDTGSSNGSGGVVLGGEDVLCHLS